MAETQVAAETLDEFLSDLDLLLKQSELADCSFLELAILAQYYTEEAQHGDLWVRPNTLELVDETHPSFSLIDTLRRKGQGTFNIFYPFQNSPHQTDAKKPASNRIELDFGYGDVLIPCALSAELLARRVHIRARDIILLGGHHANICFNPYTNPGCRLFLEARHKLAILQYNIFGAVQCKAPYIAQSYSLVDCFGETSSKSAQMQYGLECYEYHIAQWNSSMIGLARDQQVPYAWLGPNTRMKSVIITPGPEIPTTVDTISSGYRARCLARFPFI